MFTTITRREMLGLLGGTAVIAGGCATLNPLNLVSDDLKERQENFLALGFGLFLHFNLATFYQLEWANGYEDPDRFSPARLDCGQWADAAADAGMKYAVLTAKHTGAWCLWDSQYTTHDIASFKKFKDGKGDVVREFVDAFRARGLKVGLYYCMPGDYAEPINGWLTPPGKLDLKGLPPEAAGDYVGFMEKQCAELLRNYSPDLIWLDQYRNRFTWRRWQELKNHLHTVAPHCLIIANNGRNLRDSDIISYEMPVSGPRQVREGNRLPSEGCDTIQKDGKWFWHGPKQAADLKSAADIVAKLRFLNRNRCNYLLNVQPDPDGLISGVHRERMREIGALLRTG